jgi:hypothetical protein
MCKQLSAILAKMSVLDCVSHMYATVILLCYNVSLVVVFLGLH